MVPSPQEEMTYYALRSHTLKDAEREEIRRKTEEFLKWKHNQIQVIPFGVSGENHTYKYDQSKGYALKVQDTESIRRNKKAFLLEYDWSGAVFGTVTIGRRVKEEKDSYGALWLALCSCGNEFPIPSGKLRDKSVKCLRCGSWKNENTKS